MRGTQQLRTHGRVIGLHDNEPACRKFGTVVELPRDPPKKTKHNSTGGGGGVEAGGVGRLGAAPNPHLARGVARRGPK